MSPLALPVTGLGGWIYLGEPLHWAGMTAVLCLCGAIAVVLPALVISARGVPLILIPVGVRKWYRQRAKDARGDDYRPHIPMYLQRAIKAADRNRCAYCKTPYAGPRSLQLDHFRPFSQGGLTVFWNMLTLCARCNRIKCDYWVSRKQRRYGYYTYNPFAGAGNAALAAQILAFERWHRFSPGRWIRAGLSLAA